MATAVLSGELLPHGDACSSQLIETGVVAVARRSPDRHQGRACNPPQFSTSLYTAIPEERDGKWFLTIASGFHLPPYTGTADLSDFHLVTGVTTTFFTDEFDHRGPGAAMTALGRGSVGVGAVSIGPPPSLAPASLSAPPPATKLENGRSISIMQRRRRRCCLGVLLRAMLPLLGDASRQSVIAARFGP